MPLVFTQLDLAKEKALCETIFLIYTDYDVNAYQYRLMSRDKYFYDCLDLDSLIAMLRSYEWEDYKFYQKGIEVPQDEIIKVIDHIHHYEELAISINALGNSEDYYGCYGGRDLWKEFYYDLTGRNYVSIESGYIPKQAYLNGVLLHTSQWYYRANYFYYTGGVSLSAEDWFTVHFEKDCTAITDGNGPCSFGTPTAFFFMTP